MKSRAYCLLLALTLVACHGKPKAPQTTALPDEPPGIAWFDGSVEGAFIAAKRSHRPVFLYWGASWCPACQQLKSTVFTRPDFIQKMKLFVPVYVDGDDAGAQKWGDQFGVQGYPTLVVLDAERHELMRIAGSMDLTQYATVLDTALDELQPVSAALETVAHGGELDAGACHRLAYNAWGLDDLRPGEYVMREQRLTAAAAACPGDAQSERARLQIFAAYFGAGAEADTLAKREPPSAALDEAVDRVGKILTQPALALSATDALQYLDNNFFLAVQARGPHYAAPLRDAYVMAMDAASNDARFAEADQLAAIASKLQALQWLGAPAVSNVQRKNRGKNKAAAQGNAKGSTSREVPAAVAQAARARVAVALAGAKDPFVRSGIIDSALAIYDTLGDEVVAYKLVQAEIPHSGTPYYYEADLAAIAEKLGHKDDALRLFNRAYRDSQGAATRFQWGQLYVSGLLRMAPKDAMRIEDAGSQVLAELDGPDRIYRRARVRLEKLDRELRAWNMAAKGKYEDVLQALHSRMQQICVKIPNEESARTHCDAFLRPAA